MRTVRNRLCRIDEMQREETIAYVVKLGLGVVYRISGSQVGDCFPHRFNVAMLLQSNNQLLVP